MRATMGYHHKVAKGVSEKELLEWVVDLAHLLGWQVRHIRDSRGQDVAGLPDLELWNVKLGLFIRIELKTERGKLTMDHMTPRGVFVAGQQETIEQLRVCGQRVYVFRPSDWVAGNIERVLKGLDK